MKIILFTLVSLCLSHVGALSTGHSEANNSTSQTRATETCGDPSVSTIFYKGFHAPDQVHTFNTQARFVDSMTRGAGWQSTIPSFRGWISGGQPGTVPLFFIQSSTTRDVTFTLNGSTNGNIVGYVYPTQICNSVPLYAAAQVPLADHWYTTILAEHNELLGLGWADQGILAYVLPIGDNAITVSEQSFSL
ncbi:hypothetical protein GALMADRAFT_138724 [Galerina marginata CBS 339.88]|uniref:DUF5648 domain-containing protein n=1 Tax=Galerina marginata (strain CBS 339.88) TaxID=685588 RepID=A0A067T5L8_GALM3|nr:hypothetical protein GALMADRAFT_138724 [Galerina marginata CBS 339.88]